MLNLSKHEEYANKQLQKMPKLAVAEIKTRKIYYVSYVDGTGFVKELYFDDYQKFFTITELLYAAKRKFTYKIINDSYVTLKK